MTVVQLDQAIDPNWWRQATVYQIYPRSFADANGDGIGDLKGITSRVPYLQELGVDAVWLTPFYPSPLKDGGYDVADYRNVDPKIGTLDDFDEMIVAFRRAGIKVVVDIVPNHCSSDHPWFQEALRSGPGSDARARFHFHDGASSTFWHYMGSGVELTTGKGPDKSEPPNEWLSTWRESVWTPVGDGQFYLHLYDAMQPDLNWDHPEVRADFLQTLRFWGDRGVAGYRVDVAGGLVKDMSEPFMSLAEVQLRAGMLRQNGKPKNYHPYLDREGVFEIYRDWRKVFNEYDPPLTAVAEILVSPDRVALFASPDGLGQAFAFELSKEPYNAPAFRKMIDTLYQTARDAGTTTTWVLSNHDVVRHATRYAVPECTSLAKGWSTFYNELLLNKGKGVDLAVGLRRARAAMMLCLALPGSTYLYQGEELGLPEVIDLPDDKRQDPIFFVNKGRKVGRDGCRVPLPWDESSTSFGFSPSTAKSEPWLPMPDWFRDYSVKNENAIPDSTLNLYRQALCLRRELQDPSETMEWVGQPNDHVLHFARPGGWHVVTNMAKEDGVVLPEGEVLLLSGALVDGRLPRDATAWVRVKNG